MEISFDEEGLCMHVRSVFLSSSQYLHHWHSYANTGKLGSEVVGLSVTDLRAG